MCTLNQLCVFYCRDYEPRLVHIEKKDTLGISIAAGCQGGVFVCSVNEGSVAAKAGLKYGDQLLEVWMSIFNNLLRIKLPVNSTAL